MVLSGTCAAPRPNRSSTCLYCFGPEQLFSDTQSSSATLDGSIRHEKYFAQGAVAVPAAAAGALSAAATTRASRAAHSLASQSYYVGRERGSQRHFARYYSASKFSMSLRHGLLGQNINCRSLAQGSSRRDSQLPSVDQMRSRPSLDHFHSLPQEHRASGTNVARISTLTHPHRTKRSLIELNLHSMTRR